jgi:energy-coupling factor transporter transmembrane protein EcfT
MESGRNDKRPTWWLLYAIGLLLVGLIGLVEATVPRGGARSILEVVVVTLMFGLMVIWVHYNRVAIELEEAGPRPRCRELEQSLVGRNGNRVSRGPEAGTRSRDPRASALISAP